MRHPHQKDHHKKNHPKDHTLHLLALVSMLLLLTTLYYRERTIEEARVLLQRFSNSQVAFGGSDLCVAGSWVGFLTANINSLGQTTGWKCVFDSQRYCQAGSDGAWQNCTYPSSFRHPWPEPVTP